MKKGLNFFCVLMLLLLASQVIMLFVVGADAFQEGFKQGSETEYKPTWTNLFLSFVGLFALVACIVSFVCFIRFILNVNHNKVFVWENVKLLRLSAYGLMFIAALESGNELCSGRDFIDIYNDFFDTFQFGIFSLIVAEVFAVGLKLQEEQDLTI